MILLQIYTVIIAAALAGLNRIPCVKMRDFSASINEEKEWHKINATVKILIAYWKASFIIYRWPFHFAIDWHLLLVFIVLLLIMWTVFDCVLAVLLHGWKEIFYIGNTAKTDKLLKEVFAEQAGLMKFLIACVLILFINFYL